MGPQTIGQALLNPDTIIRLAIELKEERAARMKLEALNSRLMVENQTMQPKADDFDELVDRGMNLNFHETAKVLGVKEREVVSFLLSHKDVFGDKKGKRQPFAQYVGDLLW
ncbi:MAG: phage antirepressor KilAC domain-containing protein [Clostridiales bacterium]|nr:phage antirepressor KilAC domain-containing protein [Clostridiales bacterium]MDO4349180.1 phage antirepressor KilAC domain-containing protein [Eubacteriales bacterium]MDY4007694.1 phage antirepressor KilAC domain-containing protein [Candidatus Limiplasma sp.]